MITDIKTPAFIFDITKLKKKIASIRKDFGKNIKLCYAIKANPFLVKEASEVVDCLEVCSPGEYRICEKLNIPRQKIVLSGVFKEYNDIKKIVSQCGDKTTYTVESIAQLNLLHKLAKANKLTLPVVLRLSSGNQFGMDNDTIENIISTRDKYCVNIKGIQYYSGTQKKTEKIVKEIDMLTQLKTDILQKFNFKIERIEYGPGLKINYFTQETEQQDIKTIVEHLRGIDAEIVLEMGRYMVAECGEYHTSVVDIKCNYQTNYCIVDGGINHLNYYGQVMAMKLPYIEVVKRGKLMLDTKYTICGSLCTTADVLVKDFACNGLEVNDKLIFKNTGAYSVTEGIYLFLSRDMPRIYKKVDNKLKLVRNVVQTNIFNN